VFVEKLQHSAMPTFFNTQRRCLQQCRAVSRQRRHWLYK